PAGRVPGRRGTGTQPDQPQRAARLPRACPAAHPRPWRRRTADRRRRARVPAAAQQPARVRRLVTAFQRLLGPEGAAALAVAREVAGPDPLAAASAVRARGVEPELAAAALTQVELRSRAVDKFGAD